VGCGDGLLFEFPPLTGDALLTTLHPLLENVLQTVDHFEISCLLGAPFSWLEKPRELKGRDLDCMTDVLMEFHRSTFSKLNTEFNVPETRRDCIKLETELDSSFHSNNIYKLHPQLVTKCCTGPSNLWALVNMLMNLLVPLKMGNFLTSRVTVGFPRTLLHGVSETYLKPMG
jgi:hypothetical protein